MVAGELHSRRGVSPGFRSFHHSVVVQASYVEAVGGPKAKARLLADGGAARGTLGLVTLEKGENCWAGLPFPDTT